MASVNFSFNGLNTIILCLKNEKMKDICNRFSSKINKNLNEIYFLYGGQKIQYDLSFIEQANSLDKERNKMDIA